MRKVVPDAYSTCRGSRAASPRRPLMTFDTVIGDTPERAVTF
jgi:hypothetical protein